MNNNKILNAAVIGLGVGEKHIYGYQSISRCRVTHLCDYNNEKLKEIGRKYPNCILTTLPEKILENSDVDVVSVASYDNYHYEQIILALQHGKHVFVEKPLCLFQDELTK